MRLPFLPPPSSEELASRTLHELLRDYPELAELLEGGAGREGEEGWRSWPGSLRDDAGRLLAWRESLRR